MFVRIGNTPRDYAWGSTTAIAELLGTEPSGGPEAELWLGAHPASPSQVLEPAAAGGARDLVEVVAGEGERLPYLLKVLAAAGPLSLQAHPSPSRARAGFERENAAGVPLSAPERNYKDPFHKPELIYALSERFEALCGFRPVSESVAIVDELRMAAAGGGAGRDALEELRSRLGGGVSGRDAGGSGVGGEGASGDAGGSGVGGVGASAGAGGDGGASGGAALRDTVGWLLGGGPRVGDLVEAVVAASAGVLTSGNAGAFAASLATVGDLARAYPGDPGIVLSLLLNRVTLRRGEALYLPAGNIHAYLEGLGIELMAASDNVLRGGLTPKHIDVPELLAVLEFEPVPVPHLRGQVAGPGVEAFRPDVPDFALLHVEVGGADAGAALSATGPAIALCTRGKARLSGTTGEVALRRGDAVYVSAGEAPLRVVGDATLFVAVPNG
ncbi:class I mannose-6-phosphate isomerase [Microbacterium sp. STN6]|uniref:type I phosphomannose isomerase catalytic subunit n=1 Tax=Microbacterium sp. STN6 TaxID=2995588 RepID=UPI002260B28B|nr:type I phosphomannose isomerase catalytic subunit [Microbacterium sp. STN6]MCX7521065.1 class I mannose-6-phosphate isomerase [Microbacterium sp. STN6]